MDTLKEILTSLLENVGTPSEVEQYLRAFRQVDADRFAVIKVGGGIIQDQMDTLASSLVLLRHVGLFPIVLHGAGPQLDRALSRLGIASPRVDGLRVTCPKTLAVARRVFQEANLSLVAALERRGVTARPIMSGVFEASVIDNERFGFVGDVEAVDTRPIRAAIHAGHLPIVSCLGETTSGQILNVNADVATRALARSVQPSKVVFLTPSGGLRDEHDEVIPAVNLVEDLDDLLAAPWVTGGMTLKLREIASLLDCLPERSSVSITATRHLARELFTHRGRGTLVRRGSPITVAHAWDDIDAGALTRLVETAFERTLHPKALTERPLRAIYATKSWNAAAVITEVDGVPYLDKFAVTAEAQGQGLGATIWNRVRADYPALFWRARPDNPVAGWYFRHADGMQRTDAWTVFWCGVADRDVIARCIQHASSMPESFLASPVKEVAHAVA